MLNPEPPKFIWQSGPRWTVVSLGVVVLQGLLPLVTLYLLKLAVDAVEGSLGYDAILGFKPLTVFIALLGVASLLEAASVSLDRIINLVQGSVVTNRMYDLLHAKSAEADLEYYENAQYHDNLHRAQQEAAVRPSRVLQNIRLLFQNGISLLAIGALLLWLHWGVVLVLLAAAIPGAIVRLRYSKKLHAWERQRTPIEREASYLSGLLTGDAYAKELRLFGLGSLFMERFRAVQTRLLRERVSFARKKTWAELLTMSTAICVSFGLLGYLALRTTQGLMSLGDLVMFYAAVQRGQILLRQVFNNVADLYEDNLFLSNLYDFLGLKPKLKEPAHPKRLNPRLQAASSSTA